MVFTGFRKIQKINSLAERHAPTSRSIERMKIAMICSGLEPGRDGVGDYTRQLAAVLAGWGHEVLLLALNDGRVVDAFATESEAGVVACRWSSRQPWQARADAARARIATFAPDWISLQFVCYGWHPKGLPFGLPGRLKSICGDVPVHLMFHELWVSSVVVEPMRRRLVGWVQQEAVIYRLLRRLRPAKIHCNIYPYTVLLGRRGYAAERLPLFGNIPLAAPSEDFLTSALAPYGGRASCVLLGSFGSIHPGSLPSALLRRMQDYAQARGKQLVVLSAGGIGSGADVWGEAQRTHPDLHFIRLGALSPIEVSLYLSSLDFGLATTPWAVIGKSGSAAAMLEHGLPVIVSRNDAVRRDRRDIDVSQGNDPQLCCFASASFEPWLATASRRAPKATAHAVARQFLDALEHARA